jgi:hypothetical protein
MHHSAAARAIGRTTLTAYRHVHEVVASAVDNIVETLRTPAPDYRQHAARLLALVARALILVKYQEARGQISRELSEALTNLLGTLSNQLRDLASGRGSLEAVRQSAENARLLVDAIAVLVYNYARK